MTSGLIQLVAQGSQDIYLTGSPQITFFKIVYRRYTNFSIQVVEQPFSAEPNFGKKISVKISKNGDLISKMYVKVCLNEIDPHGSKIAWIKRLGHALIKQVDIEIGGSKIDRHYGSWLDIWYELARKGDHERGYAYMIGDIPELTNFDNNLKPEYVLFVPLQFWFNKFIGLSIPLIALQYQDIIMNVEFEEIDKLLIRSSDYEINNISIKNASLLINYIYLDTEERKRFAQVGHEYLIEQLQFNGEELIQSNNSKFVLDFNHPVKEIIWVMKNGNYISGKKFIYYTDKEEWDQQTIIDASEQIVQKSIAIGNNPSDISGGNWSEIKPKNFDIIGTFAVNNNMNISVWINPESLKIGEYIITNKITADIEIESTGNIIYKDIKTSLSIRDLSIPIDLMEDTRFNTNDPIIYQFSNYGLLIDGSVNPTQFAQIQFNGYDRFEKREGAYFNYIQPEQHHENTPKDGINVYSFALYPEEHQPSGTVNLSRIEKSELIISFSDPTQSENQPQLNFINFESRMYIFATNYNIFRMLNGLSGICYTSS
ncbi:Large eukaryotic DNA virus major capsid protein [uncultured virus]|nr:Large eukaryotic DNA virus major capsid protein [uncultured virus]